MAALKDKLMTEPATLTSLPAEFDFTNGMPDMDVDNNGWRIYNALMRQYRLAHGTETEKDFPSPEGKKFTIAEIEARGIDPNKPSVKANCCGK